MPGGFQLHFVNSHLHCLNDLPAGEARQVWHERLDEKQSAGSKPLGDVSKTSHLLLLRPQSEEGVESDKDQRVVAARPDRDEVSWRYGGAASAGRGAPLSHRRLRRVNAADGEARARGR